MRFSLAFAIFDLVSLVGPTEPAVRPFLAEGRGILADLRATLLMGRFEAMVARSASGTFAHEPDAGEVTSRRQADVVGRGLSRASSAS